MDTLWALLIQERIAKGYKSRRTFFIKGGGRAYFGCTYRFYCHIENGTHLPDLNLLGKILIKLKVTHVEKFIMAYFMSAQKDEHTRQYFTKLLDKKVSEMNEISQEKEDNVYYYNKEQLSVLASSREINWLFKIFLFNNNKAISIEKLEIFTQIERKLLETYINRLIEVKLLCHKGNKVQCTEFLYIHPTDLELRKYVRKISEYDASFSPHDPLKKFSMIFKVHPDDIFFIEQEMEHIINKIGNLTKESLKDKKTFFFHTSIFERFDLNLS